MTINETRAHKGPRPAHPYSAELDKDLPLRKGGSVNSDGVMPISAVI
jgi:hypothetical protein